MVNPKERDDGVGSRLCYSSPTSSPRSGHRETPMARRERWRSRRRTLPAARSTVFVSANTFLYCGRQRGRRHRNLMALSMISTTSCHYPYYVKNSLC